MVPRENKNNAYAKFRSETKSIMVFLKVAYCRKVNRNRVITDGRCKSL